MLSGRLQRAAIASGCVVGLVALGPVAHADPVTDFEAPFPCGQGWQGSTRDSHSPSRNAVDLNRPDDLGDPVVASATGTVTTADSVDDSGYGRWVVIDHGNRERSLYAHLQKVIVSVGQRVDQGQQIGTVGSTGRSTGAHLHFEEKRDAKVTWPFFHGLKFSFGTTLTSRNCVDVPLAGDWNGDRRAQPTVFRRSAPASFLTYRPDRSPTVRRFGKITDVPVLGDWDGDGRANVGIRRPAARAFVLRSAQGKVKIVWGAATGQPVAGDWDGDGVSEVGLWSPAPAAFSLRATDGSVQTVALGDSDDLPVTGDWNGDGQTDLAVFDQATAQFTLRQAGADGIVWLATVQFGSAGDLPVTGDWDGNGRTDLGTWTPETAVFHERNAPTATTAARTVRDVRFGKRR